MEMNRPASGPHPFLIPVFLLVLTSNAFASQPWDEPFSSSTAQIVKSAAAIPNADAEVVILLDDYRYMIRKDGTSVSVFRRVYRVATAEALDDWASIEQEWAPWHEARPELRARVISPDGAVHWLDQKTIAEAPAAQFDNTLYTDGKLLRTPLPAVAEGAVVEYEVTRRETPPLPGAGIAGELQIDASLPLERFHVQLDVENGVDLHTGTDLVPPAAINRSESNKGIHFEIDLGRQDARKDLESYVPADQPQFPGFRFSTGLSWNAIAASYQQAMAGQVTSGLSSEILNDLGLSATAKYATALEAAEKLTAILHQHVRYTGVEFGQAAIIPNSPGEVVRRHYGDCKDKAALLVALLRRAGFDAHMALLNVGQQQDLDPKLPGFGLFNHAIVYVAGSQPLWIDATAENTRVGTLPLPDQGRLALIVSGSTSALIPVPASTAAENRIMHKIEVHLSNYGKGYIIESMEPKGSFESNLRAIYGGNERELRSAIDRLAKTTFVGESSGQFSVTPKGDFSKPFHVTLEVKNSAAIVTQLQDAAARFSNGLLFENLPYSLSATDQAGDSSAEGVVPKSRKHDFIIRAPYQAEIHFKIFPPPDFTPRDLPPPENFESPDAAYHMTSTSEKDGTLECDYRFELKATRLSPASFEALRADLRKYVQESGPVFAFSYVAADLIAVGKSAEAIQSAQKSTTDDPGNAYAQMRLSQVLVETGAGQAALTAAKEAVKDDSASAKAWLTLAYAYEHDSFGRLRAGDWNQLEAEKALRKSIQLDASDIETQTELAICLEHNPAGERYPADARLPEAVAIYQGLLKKASNSMISRNLAIALMHLGRYSEAQEELRKTGPEAVHGDLGVALLALTTSPEKAIIANQNSLFDDTSRAQNLAHAGLDLDELRKYDAGSELFRAAQRLNSNQETQQMLRFFSSTQPYEKALAAGDSFTSPVQHFLVLAARSSSKPEELTALIGKHADLHEWQAKLEQTRSHLGLLRMNLRSAGAGGDTVADLLLSHIKLDAPGDKSDTKAPPAPEPAPGGDKVVTIFIPNKSSIDPSGRPKPVSMVTVTSELALGLQTFVVVREDGQTKLLATGDGLGSVGELALEAVAKGDLTSATTWLDAVQDHALPRSSRDDKGPAFRYLWAGTAPETRNVEFAKAAAASLLGTYRGSGEAVAVLRQVSQHPPQYMEREDLNFAICEALERAQNWKDLRIASEALRKSRSYQESAMRFTGEALTSLQDWPALTKAAEARLTAAPKDHNALQYAAVASMMQKDFTSASKYLSRAESSAYTGYLSDELLNAWSNILSGVASSKADNTPENGNVFSAITRGTVYAYTLALTQLRDGKPDDCRRSLALALTADGVEPSGFAWLVQAELLKYYRLDASAAVALERAAAAPTFDNNETARILLLH